MNPNTNEFYIGWQSEAPTGISRQVKQFVLAIFLVVPLVGVLFVLHQTGFATSTFEYGKVTEIEGVLVKTPAPFLLVFRGKDLNGQPVFQHILLVAPGKHGAMEMLLAREKQLGNSLEGQMVKLKGFLIDHDGKALMEVEEMAGVTGRGAAQVGLPMPILLGGGAFFGEITDPKCLFGVMKPGYGKPHRSCAARCIAGGIPPVLKSISTEETTQYYLLVNEEGEPVNREILPYVGDQVVLCGNIYKLGDWTILYKNAGKKPVVLSNTKAAKTPLCN